MSGTGPVAEGVQFTDGAVAVRWYGDYPTTTVWDGIDSVIAIHGHGGATEVEWLDPDPGPDPAVTQREDLPPQPWPELHPAPENLDEGPGPSLTRSDVAPEQKATAPIFPSEHGTAGPVFPAERSGFDQTKGLFSEFMDDALASRTPALRRTGFTELF